MKKIMISTGSRASTRSSGGPGASATTGRSHPPGTALRQTPGQEQESVIIKATARLSVCLSRYFNRKSLLVFPSLSKIKLRKPSLQDNRMQVMNGLYHSNMPKFGVEKYSNGPIWLLDTV